VVDLIDVSILLHIRVRQDVCNQRFHPANISVGKDVGAVSLIKMSKAQKMVMSRRSVLPKVLWGSGRAPMVSVAALFNCTCALLCLLQMWVVEARVDLAMAELTPLAIAESDSWNSECNFCSFFTWPSTLLAKDTL
jgi:hypothetical protein